jgi:hypothetical protein
MKMKKIVLNTIILAIAFSGVLTSLSAREVNSNDSITGGECTGCIYNSCEINDLDCVPGCTGSWDGSRFTSQPGSNYYIEKTPIDSPCSGELSSCSLPQDEYECKGC